MFIPAGLVGKEKRVVSINSGVHMSISLIREQQFDIGGEFVMRGDNQGRESRRYFLLNSIYYREITYKGRECVKP